MPSVYDLAPDWMPAALIKAWYSEYLEIGGPNVSGSASGAAEAIRNDPDYRDLYDSYFPGNRREDGSLRLSEVAYNRRVQSYENALLGVNLNPDIFRDKYGDLISGDVSESEFVQKVESMYDRVIGAAGDIRSFYAANFAIDMTEEAIVASFMDPDIGQAVLDKRIAISEIGGEAAIRKFNIDVGFARQLEQGGVTRDQAQDLFGQGALDVPVLNVLARRHADPDDDFDLNEFSKAYVFDDPVQRRRIRRLVAQERATFTGASPYEEDRRGGVTGLAVT